MGGILFLKTTNLPEVTKFYIKVLGFEHWLTQPEINIIKHENLLLGFHQATETSKCGLITVFLNEKEEVDELYSKLHDLGLVKTEPKENKKYRIYNFFAEDIEGRDLEFQIFLHDLPPV
ncbi:MAG: VOC family protein [Methanobacteriota archaeon]|nr:MAG: VOC family protein [Euryarchaeota archaeon]